MNKTLSQAEEIILKKIKRAEELVNKKAKPNEEVEIVFINYGNKNDGYYIGVYNADNGVTEQMSECQDPLITEVDAINNHIAMNIICNIAGVMYCF